jgi:hypothetical protein
MKMKLYAMMVIAMIAALQTQAALVAKYDFNGLSANDGSGNGYDGTVTDPGVVNATGINGSGGFDNSAASGHASAFAGRVGIDKSLYYDNFAGKTAMTLSFWMSPNSVLGSATGGRLFDMRGLSIYTAGDGKLSFEFFEQDGANQVSRKYTPGTIFTNALDSWTFVSVVFNTLHTDVNRYLEVYVSDFTTNGNVGVKANRGVVMGLSAGDILTTNGTTSVALGNSTAGDKPFDGKLDYVTFHDTALSASEIKALRNEGYNQVPEPGSILMVMVGAGVLFIVRRIRARA